jgi:hypothetical protein
MLNLNIKKTRWILFRDTKDNDRIIFKFRIIEFGPEKSWIMLNWEGDDGTINCDGSVTIKVGDTRSFSYLRSTRYSHITLLTMIHIKYLHGLSKGARARIGILAHKEIKITQEDRENRA